MNRHATSGPVVIVPARVALILERELKLNELRIRVHGRDVEVDQVLLGWHAVAVQYVEDFHETKRFRLEGSSNDALRKLSDNWSTEEVAARARVTKRAVRLAASKGHLIGEQIDGRWRFTPQDATTWLTTRKRAS